ncbi:hypothetical protein LTR05_004059 [Lithohypha guttulata]|uniref:UBZ4-type domain-containing protein n=1 Tax=Lithohypha guttulata TaxID=1690604 RepID=A0AAN7T2B0_9EURO|nr:hypothetical protein LTR05_004059 [Lithohypha guttulata]
MSDQNQEARNLVPCPYCNQLVEERLVNAHLDTCVVVDEKQDQPKKIKLVFKPASSAPSPKISLRLLAKKFTQATKAICDCNEYLLKFQKESEHNPAILDDEKLIATQAILAEAEIHREGLLRRATCLSQQGKIEFTKIAQQEMLKLNTQTWDDESAAEESEPEESKPPAQPFQVPTWLSSSTSGVETRTFQSGYMDRHVLAGRYGRKMQNLADQALRPDLRIYRGDDGKAELAKVRAAYTQAMTLVADQEDLAKNEELMAVEAATSTRSRRKDEVGRNWREEFPGWYAEE